MKNLWSKLEKNVNEPGIQEILGCKISSNSSAVISACNLRLDFYFQPLSISENRHEVDEETRSTDSVANLFRTFLIDGNGF